MAYCILCGKRCYEDHLFCKSCFYEYKNRPIIIEFDDDGDIELLDDNINQADECFICGKETDGDFFCRSCYRKYGNKTIYLSVKNCKDVRLLDAPPVNSLALFSTKSEAKFEAAKKYKTEDGHMVRSPNEKIIDDLLFKTRIFHTYEKPLQYNKDNGYPILPDWFVPIFDNRRGIYIEYYGVTNKKKYDQRRERNQEIYDREDVPVIGIEAEEINDTLQLEKKIIMELNRLALKHFGVQHFIK